MNEEEYYGHEEDNDVQPVVAPPPQSISAQWSWSTEKLLWVAGGVVGVSFVVWFLMAFTGAKARAIAEAASNG